MDFSKLSSNEKMAVYSSVVLVLAGIISNWGGLMWLSVLAAIAVLVIVFLPQFSPATKLPGSSGSLLLALGGIAAAGAVIELLRFLNYFFSSFDDYRTWLFAIALIAALVLLWSGWQAFQAEGGKFTLGMASTTPPPPPPPMAEPMKPPMSEPMGGQPSEPMSEPMAEPMRPMGDSSGTSMGEQPMGEQPMGEQPMGEQSGDAEDDSGR